MRRRTGIPKSRLAEVLADETERTRRYPGIGFRGPEHRRRPWVSGSSFDVWEVVQAWQDLRMDAGRVQDQLDITARQLHIALVFYAAFPDGIDDAVVLARRTSTELESAYPFIEVLRIRQQ